MWEGWRNREFQRETNAQNESLMRESWARDDTAVQRSAADFEAAGLSRTLAAGNSASNSGPIKLESPKASHGVAESAIQGYAAATNIAQTEAQTELVKEQVNTQKAVARKTSAEAALAEEEADIMKWARGGGSVQWPEGTSGGGSDYAYHAKIAELRDKIHQGDIKEKEWGWVLENYDELKDLELKLKRQGLAKEEQDTILKRK